MNKKIYIIIISVLFSVIIWISIAFSDVHYAVYRLPVEVVDLPEGYTTSEILPEKITLRVRGDGWKLMSFELSGYKSFFVSVKGDSNRIITDPLANIENNPWLSSGMSIIDAYPKSIRITVEPVVSKKLKVIPQLDLDFKPGFGLASKIIIEPDSVVISGPVSKMNQLNYYKTEPIALKKLDQKTSVITPLDEIKGFEPQIKSVSVTLDVQRIIENNFSDVLVNVVNKPDNVDVVLIPNTITCTVRGGINILGKLNSQDITATVDYIQLISESPEFVVPQITIPEDVYLISFRPEKLKYVIKKY